MSKYIKSCCQLCQSIFQVCQNVRKNAQNVKCQNPFHPPLVPCCPITGGAAPYLRF